MSAENQQVQVVFEKVSADSDRIPIVYATCPEAAYIKIVGEDPPTGKYAKPLIDGAIRRRRMRLLIVDKVDIERIAQQFSNNK